ncbi:MAG: hypothetical protein ACLPT4_15380 [Verrucomicrobiia bacterium]
MDIIPNTAWEVCFLLVGAGVGFCYGFDGFSGSTKDLELQRTARLKNLKYAVTGVFLTLIADLKAARIHDPRDRLLAFYIGGFVASAIIVIVVVAAGVCLKYHWIRRSNLNRHLPQDMSPVLDYLFYGYNYYRTNTAKIIQQAQAKELADYRRYITTFLPAYVSQLSMAIAAIDASQRGMADKRVTAHTILQCIRAVVISYYGGGDNLRVNANYMAAYHKSHRPDNLESRLRFAGDDISQYEYFLVLEDYAEADGKEENFILPVANDESRQLPGAPRSFMTSSTVVIDDTSKIRFAPGLKPHIVEGLKEYFKKYFEGRNFRSFACLVVYHAGAKNGVINIESNERFVFGEPNQRKEEVELLLKPFRDLLGFVIK